MGILGGLMRRGELHPGLGNNKSILSARKGNLKHARFNWLTRILGAGEDVLFPIT